MDTATRATHYESLADSLDYRRASARKFNQQLAQRRILDREFYTANRSYIRIPVDRAEAERNARWDLLHGALQARVRWSGPHLVKQLRSMRAHPGRALFHTIAVDGVAVEYVGEGGGK